MECSSSWPKLRDQTGHGVSRLILREKVLLSAEVCERMRQDGGMFAFGTTLTVLQLHHYRF